MHPDEWRQCGTFQTVNGHAIFVLDQGAVDQDTIVLIHGFPTASWDWHRIWPALRKHYRVVALDMLGFGFSDKPAQHHYSIHEQADIVETVVGKLGLSRFHVLAHDYGDTVTQELLARQNAVGVLSQWRSVPGNPSRPVNPKTAAEPAWPPGEQTLQQTHF